MNLITSVCTLIFCDLIALFVIYLGHSDTVNMVVSTSAPSSTVSASSATSYVATGLPTATGMTFPTEILTSNPTIWNRSSTHNALHRSLSVFTMATSTRYLTVIVYVTVFSFPLSPTVLLGNRIIRFTILPLTMLCISYLI